MKNLWMFEKKRISILQKLLDCDAAAGCDLRKRLNIKKTLLSYHLGVLRGKGIIEETKQGRDKYYKIKKGRSTLIKKVVSAAG